MSDKGVKGAVRGLVEKLPNATAHAVLNELGLDSAQEGSKAHEVKYALIEHLNAMRPERVRRLFTSSFEPFLTGDINLYRTSVPIPGLILRTDIAALWTHFSEVVFPDIVKQATLVINELCEKYLVDKALETPEAKSQLAIMQNTSVRYIDQVLNKPKEIDKLLKAINQARLPAVQEQTIKLTRLIPVNASQLRLWRDILAENQTVLAYVETFLEKLESTSRHAKADLIESTVIEMKNRLSGTDQTQNLSFLIPATALNVARDYSAVSDYLQPRDVTEKQNTTIAEAITSHLEATFSAIIRKTGQYMETAGQDYHTLFLSKRSQQELDQMMDQFVALLNAAIECELPEKPGDETIVRQCLGDASTECRFHDPPACKHAGGYIVHNP